jgi:hypothetical protein
VNLLMTTIRRNDRQAAAEQRYASIAELRATWLGSRAKPTNRRGRATICAPTAPEFYVQDWTRADEAGCDDDSGPCHEMPDDPAHALRLAPGDVHVVYEG